MKTKRDTTKIREEEDFLKAPLAVNILYLVDISTCILDNYYPRTRKGTMHSVYIHTFKYEYKVIV